MTPLLGRCENCDNSGACNACASGCAACDPCNSGCQEGCNCKIYEIHKLVVHPVTKETQVKTCTVVWTAPSAAFAAARARPTAARHGACRARFGRSGPGAERQPAASAAEDHQPDGA